MDAALAHELNRRPDVYPPYALDTIMRGWFVDLHDYRDVLVFHLWRLLRKNRISYAECAARLNVCPSTVSKWVRRVWRPGVRATENISRLLREYEDEL